MTDNSKYPPFILASGSPRRREIVGTLRIPYQVIKPDIDETQRPGEPPYDYVRRLSIEKGETVAGMIRDVAPEPTIVLSADTVVILSADTIGVTGDGEVLGKPADAAEARAMLVKLRDRDHVVCTAITLLRLTGGASERNTRLTKTTVHMRDYTDDEIDAYIATGDPFDKAGGYAIQHETFRPVARIDGSYSNVVGLPVETLVAMLRATGWTSI